MSQRRVCDACAVRRVRCDGLAQCARCIDASLECTRKRPRQKSGPKGIQKKTLDKLAKVQRAPEPGQQLNPNDLRPLKANSSSFGGQAPRSDHSEHFDYDALIPTLDPYLEYPENNSISERPSDCPAVFPDQGPAYPYQISVDHLALYLDIYHHKLYPVWPIVDKNSLLTKLVSAIPDATTYMLASSVCVATVLQLQLSATDMNGVILQPEVIIEEIESLRRTQDYRENVLREQIHVAFFLHVAHLHTKKQTTSTLTLREAISLAHILDLHRPSHYETLPKDQADEDLRILWLLFITEQAHALQYDLPCTLAVPSNLPLPEASTESFMLSAFVSLCNMFKALSEASSTSSSQTALELFSYHTQLLELPKPTQPYNQLQKADVGVTQHWTRLQLWKLAVSRISMTTEPSGDITSLLFPLQVVRDLLSELSVTSVDSLEAHGSGMELKLFEFANTVADVMVCMPNRWTHGSRTGPREYLMHLGKVLGSFRGGNEALLPLLRSRFTELGLSLPHIPRVMDVTYESSDSSRARVTHVGDAIAQEDGHDQG
ncbi:hypothetical protein Q7P37_005698 [Cladosporium fusiforme]